MGDTLSCPSCNADIDVGDFPVFEGTLRVCDPCNLMLVVGVHDGAGEDGDGIAYLTEQECDDCDGEKDPACARCGGSGYEPAHAPGEEAPRG